MWSPAGCVPALGVQGHWGQITGIAVQAEADPLSPSIDQAQRAARCSCFSWLVQPRW